MVGFQVQYLFFPIGSADFLHSFFSTVAYHLEYRKWGSRFPVIMNDVYQGYLLPEHAEQAREELSDGADFITIFNHALLKAIELQLPLEIH